MKKHMKNLTQINRTVVLSVFLFVFVIFSLVSVANAVAPDPGHSFTESSGGIAQGDLIIGTGADTVAALAKNASDSRYLSNTGANNNPAWAQIDLSNGVTGSLSALNGGMGSAPSGDDQILVSDTPVAVTWRTVNDCQGTGKALTYTQASNTWGCNSISAETVTTMGTLISGATAKVTPIDADMFGLMDSTDGLLKKLSWIDVKEALVSTFLPLDNSTLAASVFIKDNNGAALNFMEGANSYLGFDTRDTIENIYSVKSHNFYAGATFTTAITARLTPRVGTVASSATPSINTDDYDVYSITALATNITSMTTNLSGSPTNFQKLIIRIKDDGSAKTIAWGASFATASAPLPTTTVASATLTVHFVYDSLATTWGCVMTSDNKTALLDGTYNVDTTAGTVSRGDVITGQGATAKWTRLAKGTAGQALTMDSTATDVAWEKPLGYTLFFQGTTASPGDGGTVYYGQMLRAPGTAAASKVYIRKAGTITMANMLCQSGTAGTNENWSMYIRKNNTSDTLIQTIGVNTNERVWSNTGLSIAVAVGDYIEIKGVQPTWPVQNPLTNICGGYVYIE
jgi:hypothetical protein